MCVSRSRALSQIINIKLCVGVLVTQLCLTLCIVWAAKQPLGNAALGALFA